MNWGMASAAMGEYASMGFRQLKDTFPAKIVKGLAFSPLTNIREFVHT